MAVRDGAIDFDHVSFVYASKADKKVLDDIDLHIRSGETIGVIGGTGASKSSLVQLIPRLYDVTGGRLTLGGVDVRDYDLETLRNAVAMVLQKNELFSGTIAENLRWGNKDATDAEIEEACKQACADEFIERFPDKYNTHIDQGGTNVSGGQKQRLCIARALLKKPDSGRLYLRCGYRHRRQDPQELCRKDSRHHGVHHCPAYFQRGKRRPCDRAG